MDKTKLAHRVNRKRFRAVAMAFVFLSHAFCLCQAMGVERLRIVQALQDSEAIRWADIVINPEDALSVRGILESIVTNPTGLSPAIQNRALVELGRFASLDGQAVPADVISVYQEVVGTPISNPNHVLLQIALVQSLRNANAPESLSFLLQETQSTDSTVSHLAANTLGLLLNPSAGIPPVVDPAFVRFEPHLGEPLNDRSRVTDWQSAAHETKDKLDKLIGIASNEEDRSLYFELGKAKQLSERLLASESPENENKASVPVQTPIPTSSVSNPEPNSKRLPNETSPVPSETQSNPKPGNKIALLGLLVALLSMGALVFKKRR